MSELKRISCPPLPERPEDGHKGTFGRVLLLGGSVGMSGSIALAAKAALRSGSGLVTAAVPQSIQAVVAGFDPCYLTIGLPCHANGEIESRSLTDVGQLVERYDAIGIGPGLGQSPAAVQMVRSVLWRARCPVVMDADALNVCAAWGILEEADRPRPASLVLTPHPGEFARLTGLTTAQIAADRERSAAAFAARHDVIVVLKGAGTVVTDGQRLFVNDSGNSGMGTGGTGDVLTGILTSLLGQGLAPLEAAALAVHVHGLAGDVAAEQLSELAMTALDVLEQLPAAWRTLSLTR